MKVTEKLDLTKEDIIKNNMILYQEQTIEIFKIRVFHVNILKGDAMSK